MSQATAAARKMRKREASTPRVAVAHERSVNAEEARRRALVRAGALVSLTVEASRQGMVEDRDVWRLQMVSRVTRQLLKHCEVDLLKIPRTHDHGQTRAAKVPFFSTSWLQQRFGGDDGIHLRLQGVAAQLSSSHSRSSISDLASALHLQSHTIERLWLRELQVGGLDSLSSSFSSLSELRLLRCDTLGPTLEVLVPLQNLRALYLGECHHVRNLRGASHMVSLRKLRLVQMDGLQSLAGLHNAPSLCDLHLIGLESLPATSELVTCLPQLTSIKIASCPLLGLSDLGQPQTEVFQDIDFLRHDASQTSSKSRRASHLDADDADANAGSDAPFAASICPNVETNMILEETCGALGLQRVSLGYMASLHELPMSILGSHLVYLQVHLCPIANLEPLSRARALKVLQLAYMDVLASLRGVENCILMRSVTLKHLPLVESLDPLEKMLELSVLRVKGCPLIKTVPSPLVCSPNLRQLEFFSLEPEPWDDFYREIVPATESFEAAADLDEEDGATDWLVSFAVLRSHLLSLLPRKDLEILYPGCGLSTVPHHLIKEGYTSITCFDRCARVIRIMQTRYAKLGIDWVVMDALRLEGLPSMCFDVVLDKALFDSVVCRERSLSAVQTLLQEMHRVLRVNGLYLLVSRGKPATRVPHFIDPDEEHRSWALVDTISIPDPETDEEDAFHLYVLQKLAGTTAAIAAAAGDY
ncbi:Methyltransferase-like protein 13 [Hondaea fermentalgiana]|uniref:Methyltransferase-like protein 13 n=1 Tax=Hondaea fermentalgiana TaxID=2315210 RepID=A0A2R5GHB8_9STRA|nr:Methyltransferase-like protein 13 [Hondaea fermentalgiana]|eukprot:GBG30297.1 Methyltransferase-like protein 13 [Hondaea fermentalgiana]